MAEPKWTPGPWAVTTSAPPGQWVLYSEAATGPGRRQLRDVGRFLGSEDDAHLIAAAPHLYAALRETLRMLEAAHRQLGMRPDDNKRVLAARATLAKADGGA